MKPTIFVIDVGAPHKGNLGWANADGVTGTDIDQCIEAVNTALSVSPVALGFEAPLYIPVRDDPLTYRHFKNHPSPMCFDVAYQPLQSSTAAEFFSSAIRAK